MSYDTNVIVLTGRLTKDVEFSYTQQTNVALCKFSIANNPQGKSEKDVVSFFNVVVWDKLAERCKQYIMKGSQVVVVGRLVQRRYEDKDGISRSVVEIIGNNVQFLGSKSDSTSGQRSPDSGVSGDTASSGEKSSSHSQGISEFDEDEEDEIPF